MKEVIEQEEASKVKHSQTDQEQNQVYLLYELHFGELSLCWLGVHMSNQGNQDSRRNQNNVIQGQRPDMQNRKTQQRT